jgi:hypothetical protein
VLLILLNIWLSLVAVLELVLINPVTAAAALVGY